MHLGLLAIVTTLKNLDKPVMADQDIESSHKEADRLLLLALKYLGDNSPDHKDVVNEIITLFEKLPKWYA